MPKTDSGPTAFHKAGLLLIPVIPVVGLLWLVSALASTGAHASCSDEDLLISRDLASKALQEGNDTVRLLLLKRSVNTCSSYPVWLQLGELQMQLENPFDAVYAFEHAVDFHPNASNGVTPDQLLRRAIANARLGEAYRTSGELAMALVATQEAVDAFDTLEQRVPRRLVQLQAKLDDAVSQADAEVMARSIEVQQDRASRGIGVRPRLLASVESVDTVKQTLALLSDYSGDPVASPAELGIEIPVPDAQGDDEGDDEIIEAVGSVLVARPAEQGATRETPQPSEARLNIPVLFEFDSARLTQESLATIEQLATALARLQLDDEDTVMVVGHTDSRGTATYNMNLSKARAEAVSDVLASRLDSQSAPPVQLQFQGRGETELRYSGEQADDHRRNRRVEVVVRQNQVVR